MAVYQRWVEEGMHEEAGDAENEKEDVIHQLKLTQNLNKINSLKQQDSLIWIGQGTVTNRLAIPLKTGLEKLDKSKKN